MRNRIEIDGAVKRFEVNEDGTTARFVLVWEKWPDGSHTIEIPVKIEDRDLIEKFRRVLGARRMFRICGYLENVSRWRSSEELGIMMEAFRV